MCYGTPYSMGRMQLASRQVVGYYSVDRCECICIDIAIDSICCFDFAARDVLASKGNICWLHQYKCACAAACRLFTSCTNSYHECCVHELRQEQGSTIVIDYTPNATIIQSQGLAMVSTRKSHCRYCRYENVQVQQGREGLAWCYWLCC